VDRITKQNIFNCRIIERSEIMQKLKMFRLVAEDGKILTDGKLKGSVVDVLEGKVQDWMEIENEDEEFENKEEN